MKTKQMSAKLRKAMVSLLTATLLLSDHTVLYAAETGAVQAASGDNA